MPRASSVSATSSLVSSPKLKSRTAKSGSSSSSMAKAAALLAARSTRSTPRSSKCCSVSSAMIMLSSTTSTRDGDASGASRSSVGTGNGESAGKLAARLGGLRRREHVDASYEVREGRARPGDRRPRAARSGRLGEQRPQPPPIVLHSGAVEEAPRVRRERGSDLRQQQPIAEMRVGQNVCRAGPVDQLVGREPGRGKRLGQPTERDQVARDQSGLWRRCPAFRATIGEPVLDPGARRQLDVEEPDQAAVLVERDSEQRLIERGATRGGRRPNRVTQACAIRDDANVV